MQLSGFPLVKVFEVYDKIYIYDARSNFLCELMPDDLYRLTNFAQYKINPFSELWQKNAFLPNDFKNVICSKKEIFEVIDEHFKYVLPRKLVLEITENCNLRCSYCFNTLGTGPRVHSEKQMTKPVIYKAIDQYFKVYTEIFSKIPDTEKNNYLKVAVPNCNWWGGEPFLNFELIKDSLLYFKNLPWNKYGIPTDNLSCCVVTNFTILNQDILDFLIENQVLLMISLDGDQDEHDKNRKFLDGSGSFEIVKRNLDHILKKYPEYCKNNVLIQAVFSKGNKKIADKDSFFRQYFYTKDGEMKVLRIGQYPKKTSSAFISSEWIKETESLKERQKKFEKLINDLKVLSDNELEVFFHKNKDIFEIFELVFLLEDTICCDLLEGYDSFPKTFACPLGYDILYVSSKGEYHICNKTDSSVPIGNVFDGIDKEKIACLYVDYLEVLSKRCKGCWNIHFCKMCPANLMQNGHFRHPTDHECKYLQEYTEWIFLMYLILYNNEDVFLKIRKIFFHGDNINFLNYHSPVFINKKLLL